jgi:hypothetical protein
MDAEHNTLVVVHNTLVVAHSTQVPDIQAVLDNMHEVDSDEGVRKQY